jgi:hypothetical protein
MDLAFILALALFVALPALVLAAACVVARKPEGEAGPEAWGAQDIDARFKGSRQ